MLSLYCSGVGSPEFIAMSTLFGFPLLPLQVQLDGLIVLTVMFVGGLYIIYKGFDEYRVGRLIRDSATETVRAAAVGRTELTGTAEPLDVVLSRPFSEGECLYANYRIEEEREDSDGNTSWTTLDSDTWVVDFILNDGTGEIRVEPEISSKYEISDAHSTTIHVAEQETEPPEVGTFLEHGTDVDPTRTSARRYIEAVIPPGTEVYVLGGAETREPERGSNAERLVVGRDDGSDRFIISDMTEPELTSTLSRRAPMMILIGLLLSAGSLYVLLTELGVG